MAPIYILGKDLSTYKTRSAMKVRAVRVYDVLEGRESVSIKSKEIVFHDEEGTFVHAHIPKEYVQKFLNKFVEGHVYGVKNFFVVTNSFSYKTTPHRYMLRFNDQTVSKEYRNEVFPWYMYRLRSISSLKEMNGINEKELIDVMGRVVEIHAPQEKVIAGNTTRLIDFVIEDQQGNQLKCTVWDHHVPKVEAYFLTNLNEPVVVLLQFCRVKKDLNNGDVKVCSSYDVTQLLFNQDSPEFVSFNESLKVDQTPLRSIASHSSFSHGYTEGGDSASQELNLLTISDVYEKRECGDYWVAACIAGIDLEKGWYYISCKTKGCHKKLEITEKGFYKCNKCNMKWCEGVFRYRLKIRVVDVNGNAPFLLWDRECNQLLGITAAELQDKSMEINKAPKEIRSLVGMSMVFRIAARKEQFSNLQNAFAVIKIINDTKLVAQYCPELLDRQDKDLTTELHATENEFDSDEEFLDHLDEVDSPVATVLSNKTKSGDDVGAVKRSLMDEFSSTQGSKKTRECIVKIEKKD